MIETYFFLNYTDFFFFDSSKNFCLFLVNGKFLWDYKIRETKL